MTTTKDVRDKTTKTIVCVLSTMRSGSTLLKALLAEAEDVSSLPEVNFQKYQGRDAREQIEQLDSSRILVLKRPAWYHETSSYPRLPNVDEGRHIALARDAYETIRSLKKMTFRKAHKMLGGLANRWLLSYWLKVVGRVCELSSEPNVHIVRYEDLVANPLDATRELFAFIGSKRQTGVDEYRAPENYEWKWGKDDGGPRIKELRVLPPVPHEYEDRALLDTILRSESALNLRRQLGYADLPNSSR